MRFSRPTSAFVSFAPSTRLLSVFLLASTLVSVIAVPISSDNSLHVHVGDISSTPNVAYLKPDGEKIQEISARATVKKPKKPKKPLKPKTTPKPKIPTNPKPTTKPTPKPKTPTKPKTPITPKPSPTPKASPTPAPQKPDGPVPAESAMTKLCKVPKDKGFFWSGTPTGAKLFAKSNKLTMDEDAYPAGFVERYSGRDGKPRDNAKRDLFTRRFSRVFAQKATGTVYVMVPWTTGPKPDRVFHADEWPILKKSLKSGRITKIVQVNPDNFKETKDYDPTPFGLTKRAADIDINNVSWDVDLDALAEKWRQLGGQQE